MGKKIYRVFLIIFILIFLVCGCKSAESSAGQNVTADSGFTDSENESTMQLQTFEGDTQMESTQESPEGDTNE